MKKGSVSVVRILIFVVAILLFLLIISPFFPVIKNTGGTIYNMSNVSQLIGTDIFGGGGGKTNIISCDKRKVESCSGDSSEEYTFSISDGVLNLKSNSAYFEGELRCDVPGVKDENSGGCLITRIYRLQDVMDLGDCDKNGYNEFCIDHNRIKTQKCSGGIDCILEKKDLNLKDIGDYVIPDEWVLNICDVYDENYPSTFYNNKEKIYISSYFTYPKDNAYGFYADYSFVVNMKFCCPTGWNWDSTYKVCCLNGDDCSDTSKYTRFKKVCANWEQYEENNNGNNKKLIKKEYCGVSQGSDCKSDDENIASGCWEYMDDPYTYNYDNSVMCLDNLGDSTKYCTIDNIETGQCLKLDFEDFYGKSVYVKDLEIKSGSDDKHNSLYIFGCNGDCSNNNNFHLIKGDVEGYNANTRVFIDKNVKAIDICPKRGSGDHKIAGIYFTTNENIVFHTSEDNNL